MKGRNRGAAGTLLAFLLVGIYVLSGCAISPQPPPSSAAVGDHAEPPPKVLRYERFTIVDPQEEDTLEKLAQKYLGDSDKAWIIAEFNDITGIKVGNEIVIPLRPFKRGGLAGKGYQMVPVLLYHDFSEDRPDTMRVSAASFEQQMRYLKENGYRVITLKQLLAFMDMKTQLPQKSVVLTIDDGWRSLYTIAYPILKKYGFPATLFVYTDFVGGRKALTWAQIRELFDNGFDIQCHTQSHRYLTRMKKDENLKSYFRALENEILQPQTLIKKKLGITCDCLAYPYGKSNSLVVAMLKKHGFRAAFTVTRGSNSVFSDPYMLKRSVIYGQYDLEKFKKNLMLFEPMEVP